MYKRTKTEIKQIAKISMRIQKAIEKQQNVKKYSVDTKKIIKQIDWLLLQDISEDTRQLLSGIKQYCEDNNTDLTFRQVSAVRFALADILWEKNNEEKD